MSRVRRTARFCARVAFWFTLVSICLVALFRVVPPPVTPLMLIRLVEGEGIDKSWRGLDDISPLLAEAVIASEDSRFCHHWGFDFDAIAAAWDRNQRSSRTLGGSTISMQTAKNVYLWPDRSWPRKVLEAWFTLLVEMSWTKSDIIETYLNVVEWGPGTYGAEAAARRWFGTSAARLTRRQAALLAAALPAPRRFRPDVPTRYLSERASVIEARMNVLGAADVPPCRTPAK